MKDQSYLDGAHAFDHNNECDDIADEIHNPYPEGTLLFDAWNDGYEGARLSAVERVAEIYKKKGYV